ncbi:DUF7521 family protein [Natrialbaceae archaeon AArc-T1-2]|uniref:DUF7521 family protein n=1 Tax=Natrialbaceae archaeon AArc-T1-2 TaxID=3053904 RepID=UPI00255AFD2B|nr:hypothetical protein [Natrialbaceae archaeon AArc-T1-2]WIV66019.1 hypothetical protein QQ977_09960 [Natrialbaceae archaeon AArc-T1-2]
MDGYTPIIVLANTATLITGGLVLTLAYRAYRRTGSHPLRAVAIGFGLIVAGSILGGLAHLVWSEVTLGVAIQSTFTAAGFAALLHSLYVSTTHTTIIRGPAE